MTARKPLRYVVGRTDHIGHRKLTTFEERNEGNAWGVKHFDTWAEAHVFIVNDACHEQRGAERALKSARRRLMRVMAMKAPA